MTPQERLDEIRNMSDEEQQELMSQVARRMAEDMKDKSMMSGREWKRAYLTSALRVVLVVGFILFVLLLILLVASPLR